MNRLKKYYKENRIVANWVVVLTLTLVYISIGNYNANNPNHIGHKEIRSIISSKPSYSSPGKGEASIRFNIAGYEEPIILKGSILGLVNNNELLRSVQLGCGLPII